MNDDDNEDNQHHQEQQQQQQKNKSTISSIFPVDSHCHLQFITEENSNHAMMTTPLSSLENFCSPLSLICATSPTTDWDPISKLFGGDPPQSQSQYPHIRFGFGIHPWWSTTTTTSSSSWQQDLVKLLERFPTACVAEIGLDRIKHAATEEEFTRQIDVFEAQMDIAAAMRRPVSVHCVRAQGAMLDLMSKRKEIERYPPAVILHGFTGSAEFVKSLLKLNKGRGSRFYFGLCSATSGSLKNFGELLHVIPKNRVLIESDCFVDVEREKANERLVKMAERLEREGGISVEDLKENFLNAMMTK